MRMNGEKRIRVEEISFESDTHNIYDPFFTSESEESSYTDSSMDSLSCYDSETNQSSADHGSSSVTSGYNSSGGGSDMRAPNTHYNRLSDLAGPAKPEYFATH